MKTEALDKFVTEMTTILQTSKDFVINQAPDVLRQIVAWKTAENAFDLIVAVLMVVVAIVVWRKASAFVRTEIEKTKGEREVYRRKEWVDFPHVFVPAGGVALLLLLFGGCGVYSSATDLIKIQVAPKVFLIEYFAKLTRGSKS